MAKPEAGFDTGLERRAMIPRGAQGGEWLRASENMDLRHMMVLSEFPVV